MKTVYVQDSDLQDAYERVALKVNQHVRNAELAGRIAESLVDAGFVSVTHLIAPPVCPNCAADYSGHAMTRRDDQWVCHRCDHVMPVEELVGL